MKALRDMRGVELEVGDTVAFSPKGSDIGIGVIKDIELYLSMIILESGEKLCTTFRDVLILPCHYKEW